MAAANPLLQAALEYPQYRSAAWSNGGGVGSGDGGASTKRTVAMLSGSELILCALHDVGFFEAQGKYTRVVCGLQSGLLNMGISAVEALLPAALFGRVHRGYLVNLALVHQVLRDDLGRMRLAVKGCRDPVMVSRSHEHRFRAGIF